MTLVSEEVLVSLAPGSSDVYTMAEAARLKGVSYHTVSRAVRRGKLPSQRLGRMALITSADLKDWRPMRERAPRKYRRREPNPDAMPAVVDLASGDRVKLATRLSVIYELLYNSAADLPITDYLTLLADRFASVVNLRRVALIGLGATGDRMSRLATFGPPLSALPGDAPVTMNGTLLETLDRGTVSVIEDVSAVSEQWGNELLNVKGLVLAPMRVGSRTLGFLLADNNSGPIVLDNDDRTLAQALASQAAMAIDRARLIARTR